MVRSPSPRLVVAPWPALASRLAHDLKPRLEQLRRLDEATNPPLIIVPGGRAANGVQHELAALLPNGFVSPTFLTVERLAERVASATSGWRPPAGQTIRSLAMAAAARAAGGPLAPGSLATVADRSWRDAIDAGIDPFSVSGRAEVSRRDFVRLATRVWRRYDTILDAAQLSDPAGLLSALLHAMATGVPVPPVAAVYGFYDATGLQTRVLRALLEQPSLTAIYLPAAMDGDQFSDDYRFAARLVHDLGLSPSDAICLTAAPDVIDLAPSLSPARQRSEVSDRIAADIESGVLPHRIGILARSFSASDLEMWRIAAARRGFALEKKRETSFTATRPGRAISLLLHLTQGDFRRGDVLEMIDLGLRKLQEIRKFSIAIAEITRSLSIASGTAETLRERFGDAQSEHVQSYIDAVSILTAVAGPDRAERPAAQWAEVIDGWTAELSLRTEVDLEALDTLATWLEQLRRIGDVPLSREDVFQSLQSLELTTGSSADVFIGDFMQARGRSFERIYVVDAIEGSMPQGRTPDPLLSDDLRQRIGMRTIGNGEAEERMLFRSVLDASRSVLITWPEAEESGRANRPSPFVTQLASAMHPDHTASVLGDLAGWLRERAPGRVPNRDRDIEAATALLRGESVEASPPLLGALTGHSRIGLKGRWDGFVSGNTDLREQLMSRLALISPTALEQYGACPHQFFVRTVLRIPENREPEDLLELESREKGNVLHSILERFYREAGPDSVASWDPERQELPHEHDRLLQDCVSWVFATVADQTPARFPVIRDLERDDALRTLRRFLVRDLSELVSSGYVPTHFEFRFGDRQESEGDAPAAAFDLGNLTVQVRGTIDRVDVAADGRIRIVDYKSSGRRYRDLQSRVLDGTVLQLAMYCRAWIALRGTAPSLMSASILPLRDAKGISAESLSFDFSEVAERLDRILELFASGISEGSFPAIPGSHCEYCPVAAGCRARYDSDEVIRLYGLTAGTLLWPEEPWG